MINRYETFLVNTAVQALELCTLIDELRGIPGRGTVDWDEIMRALAHGGYSGHVGLESFVSISEAMRAATCIWRSLAPDSDTLVREGLAYLKGRERVHFPAGRIEGAGI